MCYDTLVINKTQDYNEISSKISKGIDNNEFKMYLQFIVDNKTKKIVSSEALSRWHSPDDGIILPVKYIDIMQSTGLITKHDLYMLDMACRQLEKWENTEYKDISISCNFTRITLSEEDFANKLEAISNKYNFDRSKLAIEITEDTVEKDMGVAINNVMMCKQLGFKVYLDDLGSSCTPLSDLCDYPIDVVKIDRDILLKADKPKGKVLFSAIVDLAHKLDMAVICEGVETDDQNDLVSELDCDYIQGWYFSKPLPLEESELFIKQYAVS